MATKKRPAAAEARLAEVERLAKENENLLLGNTHTVEDVREDVKRLDAKIGHHEQALIGLTKRLRALEVLTVPQAESDSVFGARVAELEKALAELRAIVACMFADDGLALSQEVPTLRYQIDTLEASQRRQVMLNIGHGSRLCELESWRYGDANNSGCMFVYAGAEDSLLCTQDDPDHECPHTFEVER